MNILPQPEPAVNAVIVDSNMTAFDARQCINEIKGHLNSVRLLLLELDERRGWRLSVISQCGIVWSGSLGARSPSCTEN